MGTVISLCDITGHMVAPWVEAGHQAVLVDPQHGTTRMEGGVLKFAGTVEDFLNDPHMVSILRSGEVIFVASFPPCTDMAVSGARWFESKRAKDAMFQAKAVAVAEQCRTIGRLSGAPWFVENPVSVLSSVFGKAQHTFNPCDYTALEPADNYTKKTCLWTGGGFVMPAPQRDDTLGNPDDRIHKAPPVPTARTSAVRRRWDSPALSFSPTCHLQVWRRVCKHVRATPQTRPDLRGE